MSRPCVAIVIMKGNSKEFYPKGHKEDRGFVPPVDVVAC